VSTLKLALYRDELALSEMLAQGDEHGGDHNRDDDAERRIEARAPLDIDEQSECGGEREVGHPAGAPAHGKASRKLCHLGRRWGALQRRGESAEGEPGEPKSIQPIAAAVGPAKLHGDVAVEHIGGDEQRRPQCPDAEPVSARAKRSAVQQSGEAGDDHEIADRVENRNHILQHGGPRGLDERRPEVREPDEGSAPDRQHRGVEQGLDTPDTCPACGGHAQQAREDEDVGAQEEDVLERRVRRPAKQDLVHELGDVARDIGQRGDRHQSPRPLHGRQGAAAAGGTPKQDDDPNAEDHQERVAENVVVRRTPAQHHPAQVGERI
jgi:hypothetical protein